MLGFRKETSFSLFVFVLRAYTSYMFSSVSVYTNINSYNLQDAMFTDVVGRNNLFFGRDFKKSIADNKASLETLSSWQPVFTYHNQLRQQHIFFFCLQKEKNEISIYSPDVSEDKIEAVIRCELTAETITCALNAFSADLLEESYNFFLDRLRPLSEDVGDKVNFISWTSYGDYADYKIKKIKAAEWGVIRDNYTKTIKDSLDEMHSWQTWPEGGKLILFHGNPGTGKTYAIRSLASSWKNWANFHYIKEPEVLFSSSSTLQEITQTITEGIQMNDSEDALQGNHHVLVLEDAGEFLSADAKERIGSGLSKFLNLLDGIFGDDLKLSVIVTTNEPLRKIHPAVERPGRCLRNLEFSVLSDIEAAAWLKKHNHSSDDIKSTSIADLYAILRGDSERVVLKETNFGFSS